MAYNIRGKTLSTIIPESLYNKYPNFITFLDKYYEWSRKSTLAIGASQGNLNLASKFYGIKSEFYVNRDVTNTLNKSFTVDFSGQRTFIPTEKIIGVRPLTSSLTLTIGTERDYVFEKISNPKITFYYDQKYVIENSTGATLYIKDQQTGGSGNQYTTGVVTDGTETTITTTSATPRLYYTVAGYNDIGIIDVEAISAEFTHTAVNVINTELPGGSGYNNSIYGFGQIHNILFNPDYLVDSYDTLATRDAPDAFFLKYLESYGLGDIFSKTVRNRSSTDDFVRFLNAKGTPSASKFFFQAFFSKDVELAYPGLNMIKSSDGNYFVKQKMIIRCTKPLELLRNRRLKGQKSGAYVTIESIQYIASNDYYEVYIDKNTIDGTLLVDEGVLIIDNTDASIEYDIEGTLLGIFYKADIIQAGLEYDKGEIISNAYTIEGVSKIIGFVVDDITTTGIANTTITSGGTNYVVGDKLFYPKPTERLTFSATINATGHLNNGISIALTGPNNEYTYSSTNVPTIKITLEDDVKNSTLFTTTVDTYNGAIVAIGGVNYTATDIVEATPDVLTLPAVDANGLTIQSGQTIRVTIDKDLIVDRLVDTSFFDTSVGVNNSAATGYVSRVHATTGAIEEIKLNNVGAGYRKRPTTTSGITIITDGKTLTHPSLLSNSGSNNTVTYLTHNSITHASETGFIVGEEVIGDVSGASGTVIKETSATSLQVSGVVEGNQFSTSDTITGQVSRVTATVSAVVGSFGKGETVTGTNLALTISGGTTFPVGDQLNQTVLTHPSASAFTVGETISQDTTNASGVVIASTTGVTHVKDLVSGTWGTATDVVAVRTLTHANHSGAAFTVNETLTQAASGTDPTGIVVSSTVDATVFRDLGTATWNTTDNVTGGTSSITLTAANLSAVSAAGVTVTAADLDTVTVGKGIVAYSDSTFTVLKDVIGAFANSAGLNNYNTVAAENATISANVVGSTGVVQSHDGLQTLITNGSLPVGAAIQDAAGTPATATIVSVDGDEYELIHPSSGITFTVNETITQGSATGTVLAGGTADKTLFKNLGTAAWSTGADIIQTSPDVTLAHTHLDRIAFTSGNSILSHPSHSGLVFTVGETITQASSGATGTVLNGSTVDETVFKDLNTAAWVTDQNVTGGTSLVSLSSSHLTLATIGTSTIVIKEASKTFTVGNVTATGQTVVARGTITTTTNKTMLVTPATGRFIADDLITGGTTGAVTKISTINSLYTIGETVTQASSGATGKVVSTADTRMTVTNVSGTFNASNIVTGALSDMTSIPSAVATGASANLSSIGEDFGGASSVSITTDVISITNDATLNLTRGDVADITNNNTEVTLRVGYYRDYGKLFNGVTGNLSETSMKMTDSYRYQDFSYSIKSDLNYKDFGVLLKKLAHPAGMVFFNDFFIINSFQQKLNKGVNTATKEITINIYKTSVTKLIHAAPVQPFTKGGKIIGGTSGATGKVEIVHTGKLSTTLNVVRGTFVVGETLTEYVNGDYLIYELTHTAHSGSAFPLGTIVSQVTTNASGSVLTGGDDDKTLVRDLGLGTWGTATNVVAARVLNHQSHTGNSFAVGETITQASTSATGYVISSTVNETIFRDLGGGTWGASNNVTGGTSGFTLTSSNLATVSAAGITLSSSHLTAVTLTNQTAVIASSGVNDIDKLNLIFSASSLSALKDFFVNYRAVRGYDSKFEWLNESLVSFSNVVKMYGVTYSTLTHASHSGAAFTVGEHLTQVTTGATGIVITSTVDETKIKNLNTGTWGISNNVTGGTSAVTLASSHLTKISVDTTDDTNFWYTNSNIIAMYLDVSINQNTTTKRSSNDVTSTGTDSPFRNFRQTENVKTVTGAGTVAFADTSTVAANGPPGPVITVTGGSSNFINQCSPRDIITAGAHTLLVVAVASDTSLTAQRTSIAGSTGTVSGQSYTVAQKRINELNNATFDDLIQHGYAMTIQDVNNQFKSGFELTMDQFQDVFAV